jgi:hypothetical protein
VFGDKVSDTETKVEDEDEEQNREQTRESGVTSTALAPALGPPQPNFTDLSGEPDQQQAPSESVFIDLTDSPTSNKVNVSSGEEWMQV